MLELQKFLRNPENKPADLTDKYAIAVKRHPKYPNLVLFKYSQIESPFAEKIVQECRGIILDESNNWAVVSYPYNKFFNHGEGHAAPIDWATARVYEKVDGSLMTLYWYDNQWHVASSGTPDAGSNLYGTAFTFADLFWKVWRELGYKMPDDKIDTQFCYMFELCTPHNKIVVQHTANRLVFHGYRMLIDFPDADPSIRTALPADYEEGKPEDQAHRGWEIVKSYSLGSIEDVLKTLEHIPPTDGEGYVVCDAKFNRIKVKTPQYVALHHMRDGMGSRRMLEIVRSNESEEFLNYFPEFKSLHAQIKEKYLGLVNHLETEWNKVKDMDTGEEGSADHQKSCRKEFALAIRNVPHNGILFALRNGQIESIKQGLREMHIKHLVESLKIKEIIIEV
jgi:hypothetical protein